MDSYIVNDLYRAFLIAKAQYRLVGDIVLIKSDYYPKHEVVSGWNGKINEYIVNKEAA
jgi:hypothetical protein